MNENDKIVDAVVTDLTARVNDLEGANETQSDMLKHYAARVKELEHEVHALRSRLTAVALVIRP